MIAGKPNEYCEFHQYHGHSTSDYKALHYEVIKLLKIENSRSHPCWITTHQGILLSNEEEHTEGSPLDTRLTPEDSLEDYAISFHENEPTILCRPHDDALVTSLLIDNCQVIRILVDNGSSTNIMFLATLEEMEISKDRIQKSSTTLVGFNGKSTTAVRKIQLLVFVVGENRLTTFLIMDCPSAYNIILKQPWIHSMKAVPSTYLQVIHFSTRRGI
ncbi:hypothetical protein TIFTF001_029922 [Ficus carica]|uniref:Uncharacterized protein n=1 Tax=Ficus carica TaxID=3494 RepID=A0AA88DTA9_FICCA|nr:hypothetical protein TIFTF001_029922 [Ficus carica]